MRRRAALPLGLVGILVLLSLGGCKDGGAEVSVPQVEVIEQPQISQTEEQREAQLDPDAAAGTVLGEEEVVVMSEEGEPQTAAYTRVRGNGDFSVAYDPAQFSLAASEEELRFELGTGNSEENSGGGAEVFLSIRREDAPSAEQLADHYVAESDEECSVEDVTIGEGEYPAMWVSYAEGTSADSRTCSIYIFRHNEALYAAQLDSTVEAAEELAEMHTILSTLRFDEG